MDALKKIPLPWIVVGLLSLIVIIMVFQQRRSGYTPSTGSPISLMDLQEFSVFTRDQKTQYMLKLASSANELSQAATSKSIDKFQNVLRNIITQVMNIPASGPAPAPAPAPAALSPPGKSSTTGNMPCLDCLPQCRYDNSTANAMPTWKEISGWFYRNYNVHMSEGVPHAFFAAVTILGLNGPMM